MFLYRPDIDGLRAIAVFSVILFHAKLDFLNYTIFNGGFIGVDIFFVISGYLITSIIREQQRLKKFTFILFYERRIRRIIPALFLVIYFSILLSYILLLPGDLFEFAQTLLTTTFFSSNFYFWKHTGYFFTENELKPLIHTWSLSVEEQFYIIFPIGYVLVIKYLNKYTNFILIFMFAISLLWAEMESKTGSSGSFYLLPTRAWEFLIGIYAAVEDKKLKQLFNLKIRNFLSLFGLFLIIYSILMFKEKYDHPGFITLFPTLGTLLIILYSNPKNFCYKLLSKKILVFNGLISYSLYLWHQPIFAFSKHINIHFTHYNLIFMNLSLTYIIAVISWKYFEIPFRNNKIIGKKILTYFCVCSIFIFSTIGIFLIKSKGNLTRYDKSDYNLLKNENQYSKFVWKKSTEISLKEFKKTTKTKITIIGDSFSQDLVNAVFQSKLQKHIDVSYIGINYECTENEKDIICLKKNLKNNEGVKKIISTSQYVWLSMSWNKKNIEDILEIINDPSNDFFNEKLFIFGQKYFVNNDFTRKKLLKINSKERQKIFALVPDRVKDLEKKMKKSFNENNFVSLLDIFCNSDYECKVFNQNELISYDGTHLTKEGARLLGEELMKNRRILKILSR